MNKIIGILIGIIIVTTSCDSNKNSVPPSETFVDPYPIYLPSNCRLLVVVKWNGVEDANKDSEVTIWDGDKKPAWDFIRWERRNGDNMRSKYSGYNDTSDPQKFYIRYEFEAPKDDEDQYVGLKTHGAILTTNKKDFFQELKDEYHDLRIYVYYLPKEDKKEDKKYP